MAPPDRSSSLFSPGDNCWTVQSSRRMGFLVDGEAYFAAVADAFAQAKQRIMIIGWDFDSRIRLRPEASDEPILGDYLRRLVAANPDLVVYVLIWRNSVFYAKNPDIPLLPVSAWWDHPRIHYKLDDHHPIAACHHEKFVIIDDALAFTGGQDLTDERWDDRHHSPNDARRETTSHLPYPPVHDIQAVLDGEAARALAALARERWRAFTGESLAPVSSTAVLWPRGVCATLCDQRVAIARTRPPYAGQAEVREIERMNAAVIGAARRFLYIETQYFALAGVAQWLGDHLERADGPEIVLVVTLTSRGAMEQYVMAESRDRLFSDLYRRDRFGRLRTYYPVSRTEPVRDIKVHSKLMIADDTVVRLGSSNLNARSIGLDTECDIVLQGTTAGAQQSIAALRDSLLGEHLGITPEALGAAVRRTGSLIAAIEGLNTRGRRLMDFPIAISPPDAAPVTKLLDPSQPLDLQYIVDSLRPSR